MACARVIRVHSSPAAPQLLPSPALPQPPMPFSSLFDEPAMRPAVLRLVEHHLRDDLAAHVALSQTCRQVRRFYDDDSFWQRICFRAGFGRPLRRSKRGGTTPHMSWRQLVLLLVKHAGACEIKSCRAANSCFEAQYQCLARTSIHDPLPPNTDIHLHPLYFYLHFVETDPNEAQPDLPCPNTLSILISHLPTFSESRLSQYGPLCAHPNASCAFATFPPLPSITFQDAYGQPYLTVENPDGCTILDVNRGLRDMLPWNSADYSFVIEHYRSLIHTSSMTISQFAEGISRDRGFLGDHEYPFLQELVAQA